MILKHNGVRPTYELELVDFHSKIFVELTPSGYKPVWNERMLNSGCGFEIGPDTKHEIKEWNGLVYCPWCDEYFSKSQWVCL